MEENNNINIKQEEDVDGSVATESYYNPMSIMQKTAKQRETYTKWLKNLKPGDTIYMVSSIGSTDVAIHIAIVNRLTKTLIVCLINDIEHKFDNKTGYAKGKSSYWYKQLKPFTTKLTIAYEKQCLIDLCSNLTFKMVQCIDNVDRKKLIDILSKAKKKSVKKLNEESC